MEVATRFADAVAALGLNYRVAFVPFSASRNAKPNPKLGGLQLNWRVCVGMETTFISTDYSQGIAHIPGYVAAYRHTVAEAEVIAQACEHGIAQQVGWFHPKKIPAPTLAEVMESLILDASAIDYLDYEDWAGDMGFDPDSRKGEAIYRQCLSIGLKLRSMIGDAKLQELRDAAQEL